MAFEQYSEEKNALLASRRNVNCRDAYIRKTIGSTGSEVMAVGPSTKVLEEIETYDPDRKNRFGLAALAKLRTSIVDVSFSHQNWA